MLQRKAFAATFAVEVTPVLCQHGEIRWQVHCHGLIVFKPGHPYRGKDYLHRDGREFNQWWRAAIGNDLFLSAKVEPSPVPLAALRYACKASHNLLWKQYRDPRHGDRALPAHLIVSRADALSGLTLNIDFGLFDKMAELAESQEI